MHEKDGHIRNYNHPVAKDTTLVYPVSEGDFDGQSGIPCGWTKVRVYSVCSENGLTFCILTLFYVCYTEKSWTMGFPLSHHWPYVARNDDYCGNGNGSYQIPSMI